jgi:hypothetical protein
MYTKVEFSIARNTWSCKSIKSVNLSRVLEPSFAYKRYCVAGYVSFGVPGQAGHAHGAEERTFRKLLVHAGF